MQHEMIDLLVRLKQFFRKEDRFQFFLIFLGVLMNSFLELVGIGLILPFIALLSRPSILETNSHLQKIYVLFHFTSFGQFMRVMALGIILIFVVKNIFIGLLSYFQTKFIYEKQTYLSTKLFRAYLMSPYSFHLGRNLAQMQRNLGIIFSIMQGVVLQYLSIFTEAVLMTVLFIFILFIHPILIIIVTVSLGSGLACYFLMVKKKLQHWGEANQYHNMLVGQQINQGLGSIKETILLGKNQFFIDRYNYHSQQCARQMIKSDIVSKSPRFFIETAVVSLVMGGMIYYLMIGETPEKIFIILSILTIVALRVMPSLNRVSLAWNTIRFYIPGFNEIYNDLMYCERMEFLRKEKQVDGALGFSSTIRMHQVTFFYENMKIPALETVSLEIPKDKTVGFVGPSGAGKTTAIDVMLGLLDPTHGQVLVDGVDIRGHLRSWQQRIGYIPQEIYLFDDSILSNVALGLEPGEIDEEKVWKALGLAQLEDFVRSLPEGVLTKIGERGVRISGGQRQRIGIARALYNNPPVLVMDEATASLDNETERAFMDSINTLSGGKTIIIIAHRLTTIRHCDRIFFLKEGRLLAEGRYQELIDNNEDFRKMAGVGHF